MASVSCDNSKHSKQQVIDRDIAHEYRMHNTYTNKDIDTSRSHLNQYFGANDGKEARQRFRERLAECDLAHPPLRIRKDRKTAFAPIVYAPRENMKDEDVRLFFARMYDEMCDLFGKENVIYGVAHFDEIHNYIDPETKNERVSRAHLKVCIIPNTDDMSFVPPKFKKGVNMDAFYRRECFQPNMLNELADEICMELFKFKYRDGTGKKSKKTVETLKEESKAAKEQQETIDINRNILHEQTKMIEANNSILQEQQEQIKLNSDRAQEVIDMKEKLEREKEEFELHKANYRAALDKRNERILQQKEYDLEAEFRRKYGNVNWNAFEKFLLQQDQQMRQNEFDKGLEDEFGVNAESDKKRHKHDGKYLASLGLSK